MFHQLVSHNDDIRRLVERGYAVSFTADSYLIVRDIPYLDHERRLQWGAIVSKVVLIDKVRLKLENHQVFFAGSAPHNIDATPIPNLGGGAATLALGEANADIVVQRSFSNKPKRNGQWQEFSDFYEKIESYVTIISGPAYELHKASPFTFRVAPEVVSDSVFKFNDTLTARAEITDLAQKFKSEVVAIIGLGGTGGYLLDFLAKTAVKEIRAFDFDDFYVHNAFRSPGRLDPSDLGKGKAEVYRERYETFRHGLQIHHKRIDASCAGDFDGVTFAFVCVDKGGSRAEILEILLTKKIPFIDVGMGLNRKRGPLNGMMRMTYFSPDRGEVVRAQGLTELVDNPDDIYRTNIQIAELNALNACMAVMKYKQLRGFYFEEVPDYHLLFEVCDMRVVGQTHAV